MRAWELSLQQGSWSSWLCPGLFLTTCRASIFLMLWPQRGSTEGMLGRAVLLVGLLKAQCLLSCYPEVENGHPGVLQWKERDRGCGLPSLIPMGLAMGRFQSPPGGSKILSPVKSGVGEGPQESSLCDIPTKNQAYKGARLLRSQRWGGTQELSSGTSARLSDMAEGLPML